MDLIAHNYHYSYANTVTSIKNFNTKYIILKFSIDLMSINRHDLSLST